MYKQAPAFDFISLVFVQSSKICSPCHAFSPVPAEKQQVLPVAEKFLGRDSIRNKQ